MTITSACTLRPGALERCVMRSLALQEWGEVLIEVRYAPVTPADIYTVRLGGVYDEDSKEPPFVAGHDAVAVVAKVRPILDFDVRGPRSRTSIEYCVKPCLG